MTARTKAKLIEAVNVAYMSGLLSDFQAQKILGDEGIVVVEARRPPGKSRDHCDA